MVRGCDEVRKMIKMERVCENVRRMDGEGYHKVMRIDRMLKRCDGVRRMMKMDRGDLR